MTALFYRGMVMLHQSMLLPDCGVICQIKEIKQAPLPWQTF